MNSKVDQYLIDGCGRCPLGGTPDCKVHNWQNELEALRGIVLDCGLNEELKWSIPCYTYKGNNICIVSAFNDFCSISFFKGALLADAHKILHKPGGNTQSARLIKFTDVNEVVKIAPILKDYIYEAVEIEKAGLNVEFKKKLDPFPEELEDILAKNSEFREAFHALTPGRQRGYLLHFSQAKQSKTRTSRIEKCIPKIMIGKGVHEY